MYMHTVFERVEPFCNPSDILSPMKLELLMCTSQASMIVLYTADCKWIHTLKIMLKTRLMLEQSENSGKHLD